MEVHWHSLIVIGILLIVIGELTLRPRIDRTRDGKMLLWYNETLNSRNYIQLW